MPPASPALMYRRSLSADGPPPAVASPAAKDRQFRAGAETRPFQVRFGAAEGSHVDGSTAAVQTLLPEARGTLGHMSRCVMVQLAAASACIPFVCCCMYMSSHCAVAVFHTCSRLFSRVPPKFPPLRASAPHGIRAHAAPWSLAPALARCCTLLTMRQHAWWAAHIACSLCSCSRNTVIPPPTLVHHDRRRCRA